MKKYYTFLLLAVILVYLFSACKNHNKTTKKVNQYLGETIFLPKDSIFILKNDSILPIKSFHLNTNKVKIVTSIDAQCHLCIHQLDQWKQEMIKKYKDHPLQFIFYLNTENYELFKRKFYHRISGSYPFLVDTTNAFIGKNNLPKSDKRFHTFLLDKNNKAIIVGNPLLTTKVKQLYIDEINKRLD